MAETEKKEPFPPVFWHANLTELFERAAYYSMASFIVIYLGQLGLGKTWPSNLNSYLWFIVYFLPILSGTIADQIGFRRALLGAFVLIGSGYFLMGYPVWLGGARLNPTIGDAFVAGPGVVVPIVFAIILIGVGGSVVKPCIAGTVQKSHAGRATLAFAIFYMVINIGSVVGRVVAFFVRRSSNLSYIFAVAVAGAVLGFLVVLFVYKEPPLPADAPKKPKKSIAEILIGMVAVLGNLRFLTFLLVTSGFWFLYNQVYNVLPLYTKRVLETNPPMEIYTAANPITIVIFQLLITRAFGKIRPIRSIVVGAVIISLAMLANLVPIYRTAALTAEAAGGSTSALVFGLLPIGSLFIVLTVVLIAFGELFTSPRTYEWIGALAPKGQEGLFLGYANLPMAIGSLVGGPVGAWLFNDVMCKNATKAPNGLFVLDRAQAALGWMILAGVGLVTAAAIFTFNVWLERRAAKEA